MGTRLGTWKGEWGSRGQGRPPAVRGTLLSPSLMKRLFYASAPSKTPMGGYTFEHLRITASAEVAGVAVITMCKTRVNALGVELMTEMTHALDRLAKDITIKGVLLSSAFPSCYCAGLDLNGMKELAQLPTDEAIDKLRDFACVVFEGMLRTLLAFPKPLATVVEGHALAGGFILALTADFIALSSKSSLKIGLTELAIGVPFPWLPQAIAEHQLGRPSARRLMFDAPVFGPQEVFEKHGFGDCLDEDPTRQALQWLQMATQRSAIAFSLTKVNYWRPVLAYREAPDVERAWAASIFNSMRPPSNM